MEYSSPVSPSSDCSDNPFLRIKQECLELEPVLELPPDGSSSENAASDHNNGNGEIMVSTSQSEVERSLREELRRAKEEISKVKMELDATKRLADKQQEQLSEATEVIGQLQKDAIMAENDLHKLRMVRAEERRARIEKFQRLPQAVGVVGREEENVFGMIRNQEESNPEIRAALPEEVATKALVPYVKPNSIPEPEVPKPASSGGSGCTNQPILQGQTASGCPDGKFPCDICEARYKYLSDLKVHKFQVHRITQTGKTVGCTVCGQIFSSFSELWDHKKQQHGRTPVRSRPPSGFVDSRIFPSSEYTAATAASSTSQFNDPNTPSTSTKMTANEKINNPQSNMDKNSESRVERYSESKHSRRKEGLQKKAIVKHALDPLNNQQCLCGYTSPIKSFVKMHVFKKNVLQKNAGFGETYQRKVSQFDCTICRRKFYNLQGLRLHMTVTHNKQRKLIIKTERMDTDDSSATVNASLNPSCVVPVQKKFSNLRRGGRSGIKINMTGRHAPNISKNPLIFGCTCGSEYSTRERLQSHIWYFNKEAKFTCNICHLIKVRTISNLNAHITTVHKDATKVVAGCYKCGMTYRSRDDYKKHCRMLHNKDRIEVGSETKGRTVTTGQDKGHVRITKSKSSNATIGKTSTELVTPAQPTPPPTVGNDNNEATQSARNVLMPLSPVERKSGISSIMQHQVDKSVVGQAEYRCTCGNTFSSEGSLQFHLQYQELTWKYACRLCITPFFSLDLLKKHMREMHQLD